MTAEEYRQQAAQLLRNELRYGKVAIRTPYEVVDPVMMDGRLRTQFGTVRSEGALAPDIRAMHEEMFFGYPQDLDEAQRPVYGYVDFGDDEGGYGGNHLRQYGDVVWTLRDDVKSRTTVSAFDSLSRPVVPGPYGDPGGRAMVPPTFQDMAGTIAPDWLREGFTGHGEYVETQTHGGVTLDDVESVDIEELVMDAVEERQVTTWGDALRRRGITLRVWDDEVGFGDPVYTNE